MLLLQDKRRERKRMKEKQKLDNEGRVGVETYICHRPTNNLMAALKSVEKKWGGVQSAGGREKGNNQ